MRPASSNSFQAFGTELWLVQHGILIHLASLRRVLTTLKLWLPPHTYSKSIGGVQSVRATEFQPRSCGLGAQVEFNQKSQAPPGRIQPLAD
jgi:hypothetical protein